MDHKADTKMRDILPSSLWAKYLAILLPVVVVVIALGLGVTTWLIQKAEKDKLDANMNATTTSFAVALTIPIWTYEIVAQDSILESILLNPNIISAQIITGSTIRSRQNKLLDAARGDITLVRKIYAPGETGLEIGTLAITYTDRRVLDDVLARIALSAILLVILVAAVVVASVIAQRRTVGAPLRAFLAAIRNSESGQSPQAVDWSSRDEMGAAIKAYNRLVDNLRVERQRLIDNETRLTGQNDSFQSIAGLRPANPGNPDDVLTVIAAVMPDVLNTSRVGIRVMDSNAPGQMLPLVQRSLPGTTQTEFGPVFLSADDQLFQDLMHGESIALSDWRNDIRFRPLDRYLTDNNVLSLIFVPIIAEGELTGLLTIEETRHIRTWARDERNYADAVAGSIASLFIAQKRHLAEGMAEEKSALLETAINTMPGGFCVIDKNMKIALINPRLESLMGLKKGMIKPGASFLDLVTLARSTTNLFLNRDHLSDTEMQERLVRSLNTREGIPRELVVNGKTYIDIKASIRPDGGVVLVINDISFRKAAEKGLIQARDNAEKATRAKSAFLAAMSHELRTPMNGVIGLLDILKRSSLDRDQGQTVSVIQESADSLLRILNDILDFSRIEAEHLDIESEPFSLRKLVDSVCASLAPSLADKDLEMLCHVDPAIADMLSGDADRLRQILINLLGNAVKFTECGHVSLSVYAEHQNQTKDRQQIGIRVEDTGIGIHEEYLPDLFEPFSQEESSTTRRFGGTGLGLSISRRIAELMGGTINVSSRPGEGSVFTVLLSLPIAQNRMPEGEKSPPLSLRAAVVTDNINRRKSLEYAIELAGYSLVSQISDSQAALRQCDMVILDPWHHSANYIMSAATAIDTQILLWDIRDDIRIPDRENIMPLPPCLSSAGLAQRITDLTGPGQDKTEMSIFDSPADSPEPKSNGIRILLVEDHSTNRLVIRRQLEYLGYNVTIARDGIDALHQVSSAPFDLIVTDCHMPNLDGHALAQNLRKFENSHDLPPVPIIALTANAMAEEREACLKSGMNDFLGKPVVISDLDKTLQRVLGHADAFNPNIYENIPIPAPTTGNDQGAGQTDDPLQRLAPKKRKSDPVTSMPPEIQEFPLLDAGQMKTLFHNDPHGPARVYDDFISANTPLVTRIHEMTKAGNMEDLLAAVHRLKGSAGVSGARRLQALAAQFETAIKDRNMSALPGLDQLLQDCFRDVCQAMREPMNTN